MVADIQAFNTINPFEFLGTPFKQLHSRLNSSSKFDDNISSNSILDTGSSEFLRRTLSADFETGAPLEVTGNAVTLGTSEGSQTLRVTPFQEATVRKISDQTLVLTNETTNQSLRIVAGDSLTVSGQGKVEILASSEKSLRLEPGESAELVRSNNNLVLREPPARIQRTVSDQPLPLTVSGPDNSSLTLLTGPSNSITFFPGQQGQVRATDSGDLKITNEDTGQTLRVDPSKTLKTQGSSELQLGSDQPLEVRGGDRLGMTATGSGLQITNQSITDSLSNFDGTNSEGDVPEAEFADALNAQLRVFGSLLDGDSVLALSPSEASSESRFGSVDTVIEPLESREADELLTGSLDRNEESQPPFFAENQVSDTFQDLPEIISSPESGRFTPTKPSVSSAILEETGAQGLLADDSSEQLTILQDNQDNFTIVGGEGGEFVLSDDDEGQSAFLDVSI